MTDWRPDRARRLSLRSPPAPNRLNSRREASPLPLAHQLLKLKRSNEESATHRAGKRTMTDARSESRGRVTALTKWIGIAISAARLILAQAAAPAPTGGTAEAVETASVEVLSTPNVGDAIRTARAG